MRDYWKHRIIYYLKSPFPRSEGFSAYRFPGVAVHLPVWGIILLVGYYLCWDEAWLRPLLIIYLISGCYLGRDIAILAHYGCFITPVVWIIWLGLIFLVPGISPGHFKQVTGSAYVALALFVTFLILLVTYVSFSKMTDGN